MARTGFTEGEAREFAVAAHGEQRYGDNPYETHLTAVVRNLEDFGFSEEYKAAGWLHDVIEDTDRSIGDISATFGARVAQLVWAVTGGGDRASHIASIHAKIATYPDAAVVKLADRIANLEACCRGDKHSIRYNREHDDFAAAVRSHVPIGMWARYLKALKDKSRLEGSDRDRR